MLLMETYAMREETGEHKKLFHKYASHQIDSRHKKWQIILMLRSKTVFPFLIAFENIPTGTTDRLPKKFTGTMIKNPLTNCGRITDY